MAGAIDKRSDRPGGGGGGVSITTAGARRIVYYDAAGNALKAEAGFEYDETLNALALGSAPVDLAGIPDGGGGNIAPIQVINGNNGGVFVDVHSTGVGAGARGGFVARNTGSGAPTAWLAAYSANSAYTYFGRTMQNRLGLVAESGDLVAGCKSAHDFYLGTNNTERVKLMGDGSGTVINRAIARPWRFVTGTATFVAGEPKMSFSSLAAAVLANLPASASVPNGIELHVSAGDATVDNANTVTLTPNGTDTVQSGFTVLNASVRSVTVCLDKTTSPAVWRGMAKT